MMGKKCWRGWNEFRHNGRAAPQALFLISSIHKGSEKPHKKSSAWEITVSLAHKKEPSTFKTHPGLLPTFHWLKHIHFRKTPFYVSQSCVVCPSISHVRIFLLEKDRACTVSEVLTHVQGSHPSLWGCWVDIWHIRRHEICDLLQCQQACGVLALLELFLNHWFQFFTESLTRQIQTVRHPFCSVEGRDLSETGLSFVFIQG